MLSGSTEYRKRTNWVCTANNYSVWDIKNILNVIDNRLDDAKQKISKLNNVALENIQNAAHKEKLMMKMKRVL